MPEPKLPTQGASGGRDMIAKIALVLALVAFTFSGYQTLRLQIANSSLEQLGLDFGQCQATLTAYLEGEEINDAIPDDLGDFVPPDAWLVPSPGSPAP
jgi:hypothetical protein